MARDIHPSAVIEQGAELGENVKIGPFCVIGPHVRLSDDCVLESHVVLDGHTEIGPGCRFSPFSSIGGRPQDLKFEGETTKLIMGKNNVVRESNTIHVGTTGGGGVTRIGDDNFFMATTHIGHDSIIGNGTIMANGATLAGHVIVEDFATVGAFSGVHQFCRVGRRAYIGGFSVVTQDALPYVLTVGNRAEGHGINVVGLKRLGMKAETLRALRNTYRILFRSKKNRADAMAEIEKQYGDVEEVCEMLAFIRASERGVIS